MCGTASVNQTAVGNQNAIAAPALVNQTVNQTAVVHQIVIVNQTGAASVNQTVIVDQTAVV